MPTSEETVTTTDRPWSEEVAIAEAGAPVPLNPVVYEFNGGKRKFIERDDPYVS